jgi:glucokinase
MGCAHEHVLLGDIGATNARFALLADGILGPIKYFPVAEFPQFSDVVDAFFNGERRPLTVHRAALAVAGPVAEDRCVLTNCPWTIDAHELCTEFGLSEVHLCNDFEVIALSLPYLATEDLYVLGGGKAVGGAPMAVLGPGTGLGVACLVPSSQGSVAIATEGGHASMAATSRREEAVIDYLRQQFGHVSAERVVSGAGLENLYRAVVALDGVDAPQRDAAEITTAALKAGCPIAKAALELFCAMLGTIAGNIALTFGARGGVYIAGGIAPRIADFMSGSDFRVRFEHKGRFRNYVEAIPSNVILHPAVTFVGLSAIANRVPGATSESHRSRDEETPRGD